VVKFRSGKKKVRWIRVIFYFLYKDKEESEENSDGEESKNPGGRMQNNFMEDDKQEGDLGQLNLQELGIYSKNEEDYKLWAINCAEEVKVQLLLAFYDFYRSDRSILTGAS
jgi:hypothetical protein